MFIFLKCKKNGGAIYDKFVLLDTFKKILIYFCKMYPELIITTIWAILGY